MTHFRIAFFSILFCLSLSGLSQIPDAESPISSISMYVDTLIYNWNSNVVGHQGQPHLAFSYNDENEVAEVTIKIDSEEAIAEVELNHSDDFEIIDSLTLIRDHIRFKVRFKELTQSNFLKFTFRIIYTLGDLDIVDIPLFPYTETYLEFYPPETELFIGEEKVMQLTTNNIDNIKIDNRWTEGLPINYRLTREGSVLLLHLLPSRLGRQPVSINTNLKKPQIKGGEIMYKLQPIVTMFQVKSGRLEFLNTDLQEVIVPDDNKTAVEIEVDNSRFLQIGKTYRVENQEDPGGPLIAELYTKTRLNNDRILCLIRLYNYHKKSEGYLYVKDDDKARSIINLDISHKTTIDEIQIQRNGSDWVSSSVVHPGELVNIKIIGKGLHRSDFKFQGAENHNFDSLIRNENLYLSSIRVPIDIVANKIEIFNHNKETGSALTVAEYKRPKSMNFVNIELGTRKVTVNEIDKPVYYEEVLRDLVISFDRSKIDEKGELFGKQYLEIDVKVTNKKGELIELYKFDNIVVCPDAASPRYGRYDNNDCRVGDINLNEFLRNKTSNLEDWSRIELEFKHKDQSAVSRKFTKKVQVVMKRRFYFNTDVSFPAGLLILQKQEDGNTGFGTFGGVNFAMIYQMSFYHPEKVAKLQPYKVGAGIIATNIFNYTENASSDLAIVVLGSVYPISSENKLSFPLYLGVGYFITKNKPFMMLGPGIRVRF
ncbi:MAG: hypothetical protein JXQ90_17850 [Cyclobacteriaceae bacterium]